MGDVGCDDANVFAAQVLRECEKKNIKQIRVSARQLWWARKDPRKKKVDMRNSNNIIAVKESESRNKLEIETRVVKKMKCMHLAFAAHHSIAPVTQTFPMSKEGVEKAFETLEDGKMRYRGVLVA